jgi:hypothetical protein
MKSQSSWVVVREGQGWGHEGVRSSVDGGCRIALSWRLVMDELRTVEVEGWWLGSRRWTRIGGVVFWVLN